MEDSLTLAFTVAKALTAGKTLNELLALQSTLQAISSLVSAEIAAMKLGGGSTLQTPSGTSQ